MPRAPSGSVEYVPAKPGDKHGHFVARVTLVDGYRARVHFDPGPDSKTARTSAEHKAAGLSEHARKKGLTRKDFQRAAKALTTTSTSAKENETCDAWYERFMAYRRSEVGSVDDDKWRWAKWISPKIGPKPIRDVTPDDAEDVRDALTAAVIAYEAAGNVTGEGRLAPKTAQNVWAAMTTAFKYAATRKGPRELRVREDRGNPCAGLPPPRDGASKHRHWCRPGEVLAVLAHPEVPRAWREAIAIGAYLHLRPGELHELRVRDLDLGVGEVRIARAFDEREKVVKAPKTEEGIRTVTIPATLVPLLKRIADERGADELVAPVVAATQEKNRASLFRTFLKRAKVVRAELYVETATHLMIDFRSLRDSGITWRFLAGERSEVVQREAGHEHIATTLGYAKEVSNKGGRFGEPFPALPEDLVKGDPEPPPDSPSESPADASLRAKRSMITWSGRRDLNPRSQAPKACALPVCATPRRSPVLPRPAPLAHRSRALPFRP